MSTITARLRQLAPAPESDAPPPVARARTRFVFLHIPKTAGTSLLTLLANTYGERHVRRLVHGQLDRRSLAKLLAAPGSDEIHCLVGHFAIQNLAGYRDTFRIFTMLRHPLERVLSLYRFIRLQPDRYRKRMGLPRDFGFEEFLANRSVEVYGQVRNGMCRVLCGIPALSDRRRDAFWRESVPPQVIGRALATLRSIDFGLAEQMPETLALMRALLRQPLTMTEHVENASTPGSERSVANMQRIAELNAADLVLYHEAQALFRARMQQLAVSAASASGPGPAENLPTLENAAEIRICDLPGRQGFHQFETKVGFAWAVGTEPAQIMFAAAPGAARLRLRIYHVIDGYPVDDVRLTINGGPIEYRRQTLDGRWSMLDTEPFEAAAQNLLALAVPYTLPARFLTPGSNDRRQLSVAVATLTLLAA